MATATSSHLLVAAFDFGTTYSGYAFSFRDNPLKVQTNQNWTAGSEKLISLKTPTCVLLKQDKTFHSFGYEAENKYGNLAEDNKHHGWLFFRRFKMVLHNSRDLSRKTTIEDIGGHKIQAMTIFAISIRYLRDHLLAALNKQKIGIEETDILYVLTVPAIWNDSAKQFMREAAIEAGIDTTRLKLALEPEAASMWCQVESDDIPVTLEKAITKYMVVDLGGGTADITVHERMTNGTLRELHKASGGPWGGMYVDNNYLKWLEQIFGKKAMDHLKEKEMADYFDLLREFETKKRLIKVDSIEPVTLRIAATLREKIEEECKEETPLESRLEFLNLSDKVTVRRDKMKIEADIVKSWFEEPVTKLLMHVKSILNEPRMIDVSCILMVGGFGESQYVQDMFRKELSVKHLVVPAEAGLVVLKGAVRFGHEPAIVSERVMQYTYGIGITDDFDYTKHPFSKLVFRTGGPVIQGVFGIYVKIGETIAIGHQVRKTLKPVGMARSCARIYRSTEDNPEFVTDPGCTVVGLLEVEHPEGDTLEDKVCEVALAFGDTELLVTATVLKTGKEFRTSINCLK